MTTAGDIIYGALRLIGQLAEGEVPSADTAQDALAAMNMMIDSWSTERLAVYATQDQTFTWPAGQAVRTLGPTGDFVGLRPVLLDAATYYVDPQGLSFTPAIINEAEYNAIVLKTVTSTYPQVIYAEASNPDATYSIYPVPTQDMIWHFISVLELAQPASLGTQLVFPPGYLRAFRYNLACELAPEFGVEPSPQVTRIAMVSKRNLKRINNPNDLMAMPSGIMGSPGRYNIYTNQPN
jgi:hypothetical protein